ncbi:MAG: alpha/beta hydrolase [Chloroflexota bacterium]|nr:MAG: alpha/beta hydrolase [Chloroflexota bacterium]
MSAQSIYKSTAGEKAVMALYDSMLASWPISCETINIPTRYGNTFVIASGDKSASPLILLHGAGTNSLTWSGDVVEYSRHYRTYVVDLLGEAGKSAAVRMDWNSPAYAEWLEDVLDALKIEKATLIGFSQGGWTALKFAVYKPERVENLVLLSPGGITPDRLSFVIKAIPLSMLGQWGIKRINRLLLAGQTVPNEVEEALILIMTHFNARVERLPIFTDLELQRLTMPVLLLMGGQDALRDGEKISSRLIEHIPHLASVVVPGSGHALLNTTGQIIPFLTKETVP